MGWWKPDMSRSVFGDAAILLFFATQAADGILTYLGVSTMGVRIEANPVLLPLVSWFGLAAAITGTKVLVAVLGMTLHKIGVHNMVATLAGVYMAAALVPWAGVFVMQIWFV